MRLVSFGYVEDVLIFLATIVPLVFFFELKPVLMASTVHLISIPCAAVAHTPKLDMLHTLFLILATTITTLVDFGTILYSVCQFLDSNLCCEVLKAVRLDCRDRYSEIMLVAFLFPVSLFNFIRGLSRIADVWWSTEGRGHQGIWNAALIATLGTYFGLLLEDAKTKTLTAEALTLLVGFILIIATLSAVFDAQASISAFILAHIVVTTQAYNSLTGAQPVFFVGIAAFALLLCTGMTYPLATVDDRWIPVLSLLTFGTASYVVVNSWGELHAFSGTVIIGYFSTYIARGFVYRVDSYYLSGFAAFFGMLCDGGSVGLFIFFDLKLRMWIWCFALASFSFLVSIVTFAVRMQSVSQIEDDIDTNIAKSDVGITESIDLEELLNPSRSQHELLIAAYQNGVAAAKTLQVDFGPEIRSNLVAHERLESALVNMDTSGFMNPSKKKTTRARIFFLRGVMAELKLDIDPHVAHQFVRSRCATLGIPFSSYEKAETFGGSWALDVGWAPRKKEDSVSGLNITLKRLVLFRIRVLKELNKSGKKLSTIDQKDVWRDVLRRYRYMAAHESFKSADRKQRYQIYWDIVWS